MLTIPGYEISAQLYQSANSIIYRGRRVADDCPVILKRLSKDYPTPDEVTRFKREYEMLHALDTVVGVIQAYTLEPYQHTWVMVLEDFGGDALANILDDKTFAYPEFMDLAIRISEIVAAIHQQHIMHKDVNPSNIVWNPGTGQLKIIDFGISTTLSREQPEIRNPEVLEGTLAYISPEQTGRMNRAMDYRTDLYSLGVTFYEMATGCLPFQTESPMEAVHAHIAKIPPAPQQINPAFPPILGQIILKLMAKTAEERYQTAAGLKTDLQRCLDQLKLTGTIDTFDLGLQDITERFQIPQRLYGREPEVETLLTAFERVCTDTTELMLVTGYAGIGKSSLVNEIHKPIVSKRGNFISGKFDQLKRNIPYSSIIQAFRELVRQILAEPEARLARWKARIQQAVGHIGQVIIEVIPEVELIIGQQSPVPDLPPTETQNRFRLVFQNFVRTLAAPDHPLVLFLDDLQWADTPSLQLLELLFSDPQMRSFLCIGAYRENEIDDMHPLRTMLKEIHNIRMTIHTIDLQPLLVEHVNQLLADTLKHDRSQTLPLATLCHQKTGGNPFFLNQLCHALYEAQIIAFDRTRRGWQWELLKIRDAAITDNVVDLMAAKIRRLPEKTQHVLKLAACIGNRFDLHTLAIVHEKSSVDTAVELWQALEEGFVVPLDDSYKYVRSHTQQASSQNPGYRFLHDRVQQAAYSLIEQADRQAVHLKIGQLLFAMTPETEREDKIFDIVNHLNLGRDLLTDQAKKDQLAELNLMAGKKAKASAAYQPAFQYLLTGIDLLGVERWQRQYKLTLALYEQAAESAYLSGNFSEMDRLTKELLQQAQTLIEKVKTYEIQIQSSVTQDNPLEAIKIGLHVLKLFEINLPEKPRKFHLLFALVKTNWTLRGKKIDALLELPEIGNLHKRAAMHLVISIGSASYIAIPELLPLVIFKALELSIKYGNAPFSAFVYGGYGFLLCGRLGNIESGYRFGKLALSLLERFNIKEYEAKVAFTVNAFIRPWKEHAKGLLRSLWETYQTGLETGDFEFAGYSATHYSYLSFFTGKNLLQFENEITQFRNTMFQLKQEPALHYLEQKLQTIFNLIGKNEDPCRLIGESYDEEKMLPIHYKANDRSAISYAHINKLVLCYLFQDYPQALDNSLIAEEYLDGSTASFVVPMFHFYDSLTRLAVYPEIVSSKQKYFLKKITANQKKMKKWAHHAPMNFLHKWYLVEAERARVLDKPTQAMDYYDKAIELAHTHEYINEEALANELAARFYLEQKKTTIAQEYMRDAHYCYTAWGALAKVRDLEKRYPELLTVVQEQPGRTYSLTETVTATQSTTSDDLDLSSVIKASQTIASEIKVSALLEKLIIIVMENAGAQHGVLILKKDQQWRIEAKGAIVENEIRVILQSEPVMSITKGHSEFENAAHSFATFPLTLLNQAIHVREAVVLDDASQQTALARDPYISTHHPKSVICLPLKKQDNVIGILYLENNLMTGAFTPERLELLSLLSTQAVIALENATMYETLDQQVLTQTAQLHTAVENAQAVNAKIEESLRYTERIQHTLLPDAQTIQTYLPHSFLIWQPKERIGGDLVLLESLTEGVLLGVFDCPGHGVPGAFMTMFAAAALKRIVRDESQSDPAMILKRLSILVKTLLKNDPDSDLADDGMNAAICLIQPAQQRLTFAGAALPIFYMNGEQLVEMPGDPQRIEYKYMHVTGNFTNHDVTLESGAVCYLVTDGFWEQIGGQESRPFDLKRLKAMLKENSKLPFDQQQQLCLRELTTHQGMAAQTDDITVVGFSINQGVI